MQTDSIEKSNILFEIQRNVPEIEVKTMYSGLLKSDNIHHINHSTTFSDPLVKNVPGLNKKTVNNSVSFFFFFFFF